MGMSVFPSAFDTPDRQGMRLPSLGRVSGRLAITAETEVPISKRGRPVAESIAMGTAVTPSTLDRPHQMGILFCSRRAEKSCVAMDYWTKPAMFALQADVPSMETTASAPELVISGDSNFCQYAVAPITCCQIVVEPSFTRRIAPALSELAAISVM
jgi:hypothetical protein